MQNTRNVLILTASYGDGHIQVAGVLKRKFEEYGFGRVRTIDLFNEAHPLMNSITKFLYINSSALSAYGLDYYGWSYYLTKDMKSSNVLAKCLNALGIRKLMKVILNEQPDLIVSTFPFGGISDHLARRGISVPFFTILTDFVLHNRWLYSTPDQFFVATEDLKRRMVERGVPESAVTVSGIPIRESFYAEARAGEEPLEAEPYMLIMAGAYGVLRDISKATEQLLAEVPGVNICVVCGKNEKLKEEMEAEFAGESRVRLYGFVEDIHKLMRGCSCFVTKAGGITLSEAIQLGIPIIVFKPFPGQEKDNASYLANQGAALVAGEVQELVEHARIILTDEARRKTMIGQAKALQTDGAADRILRDVDRFVRQQGITRQDSSA